MNIRLTLQTRANPAEASEFKDHEECVLVLFATIKTTLIDKVDTPAAGIVAKADRGLEVLTRVDVVTLAQVEIPAR